FHPVDPRCAVVGDYRLQRLPVVFRADYFLHQVLVHRFLSEVPQSSASGSPTPGSPRFHRFCPLHSPGDDRSCRALRFQIPSQLPFSLLSSSALLLPPFAPRALPRFLATTASADFFSALTE